MSQPELQPLEPDAKAAIPETVAPGATPSGGTAPAIPAASQIPIAFAAAASLGGALLAFFSKDWNWALFFVIAGLTGVQASLDFYEDKKKKARWSAITRGFTLVAAGVALYLR